MQTPISPTKAAPDSSNSKGAGEKAGTDSLQPNTATAELPFEVLRCAYHSLESAAGKIKRATDRFIEKLPGPEKRILLLPFPPGAALDALDGFRSQVANLRQVFQSSAEAAEEGLAILRQTDSSKGMVEALGLGSAPAGREAMAMVAGAALQLLQLLRQDVNYQGREVVLNPLAFTLHLASMWENDSKVRVECPRLYPNGASPAFHALLDAYAGLGIFRQTAYRNVHALVQGIARLKPEDPRLPAVQFSLNYSRELFQSADQVYEQLGSRLGSAGGDEKPGVPTLLELIRAGISLEEAEGDSNAVVLYHQIFASGGHVRTVKSVLRTMFFGDGVGTSGGVVAGYALFYPRDRRIWCSSTYGANSEWERGKPLEFTQ